MHTCHQATPEILIPTAPASPRGPWIVSCSSSTASVSPQRPRTTPYRQLMCAAAPQPVLFYRIHPETTPQGASSQHQHNNLFKDVCSLFVHWAKAKGSSGAEESGVGHTEVTGCWRESGKPGWQSQKRRWSTSRDGSEALQLVACATLLYASTACCAGL